MVQQYRNPYVRAANAERLRQDNPEEIAPEAETEKPESEANSAENRTIEIEDQDQPETAADAGSAEPAQEEPSPAEDVAQSFEGDANYMGPLFGGAVQEEVDALKAEIENLRLRQAAEMENFKKRLAREHQEQLQYAAEKVLGDLLPTLDNLELAMQYGNTSDACKDLLQGVSMTHKLLLDAVQKHGLLPVGEVGETFDPSIHEAVGFDPQSELEAGKVARVLQRGYKLGSRLLRPARVMITQ
ncbi:MAG: nucleotide exchange factor GrpE [Desulfovibrio sp.]|nr:nucleotide exchange factor GrpE [Desulfovibrio sp.]